MKPFNRPVLPLAAGRRQHVGRLQGRRGYQGGCTAPASGLALTPWPGYLNICATSGSPMLNAR